MTTPLQGVHQHVATMETILNQVDMALKLDSVRASGEIPRQRAVRPPIRIKLAGELVPGM